MHTLSFAITPVGLFIQYTGEIDNLLGEDTITLGPLTLAEALALRDVLSESILTMNVSEESLQHRTLTDTRTPQ